MGVVQGLITHHRIAAIMTVFRSFKALTEYFQELCTTCLYIYKQ